MRPSCLPCSSRAAWYPPFSRRSPSSRRALISAAITGRFAMSSSSSAFSRSYASWDSQVPSRSVVDTMGSPPGGKSETTKLPKQVLRPHCGKLAATCRLPGPAAERVDGVRPAPGGQCVPDADRSAGTHRYLGVPDLGAGAVLGLQAADRRPGVPFADAERHGDGGVGDLLRRRDLWLV